MKISLSIRVAFYSVCLCLLFALGLLSGLNGDKGVIFGASVVAVIAAMVVGFGISMGEFDKS